jgi:hypothetical protein
MTTVRVLVDHVGEYMAGDIITDAPAGLVHMAQVGTVNAGTGQRIAEIVTGSINSGSVDSEEVQEAIAIIKEIRSAAVSLEIPEAETLSITQLIEEIAKVQFGLLEKEKADALLLEKEKADKDAADALATAELADLKKQAKELKIEGYTKMDAEELKVAIAAHVGSEPDGK